MNNGKAPDSELLNRFVDLQDHAAFEELVRRHAGMVYRLSRRITGSAHDSEDAVQKVFVKLAQRANTLTGCRSLSGWLYSTAWYLALQQRRSTERRRRREAAAAVNAACQPFGEVEQKETYYELYRAMEMLPAEHRTVIVLHHLEGMRIADIAMLFDEPVGTIAARLSRGRAMIRERFARRGEHLPEWYVAGFLEMDFQTVEAPDLTELCQHVGELVEKAIETHPPSALPVAAAAATAGASAPSAPVCTSAYLLGLLQGRAAIIAGMFVVASGAAAAPASRQWILSITGWGQSPVMVEPDEEESYVESLPAPKASGRSSSGGGSTRMVPEPGATAVVCLATSIVCLRRRR